MKRILFLAMACITIINASAQKKKLVDTKQPAQPAVYDASLIKHVNYRLLGPFRGGRSGAVGASYKSKNTFYFGATGGGVWKSIDGGNNWKNVTDKYFGSSIGAVEVAPSNENIVYVGEGENTMRGNVSEGLGGMW